MKAAQLCNRTSIVAGLTVNEHAHVNDVGELSWSCAVSGAGVKAWADGHELAKGNEAKARDRADEILELHVHVLVARVRAGLAVTS
jgi:hypothetical protein